MNSERPLDLPQLVTPKPPARTTRLAMPFASSSTVHSLGSRSIPLITASILSISLYTVHQHFHPLHTDDLGIDKLSTSTKKQRTALAAASSPYTPLGWGSNRYLTLVPDSTISVLKRPLPLSRLGATPLRDLVLMEKYGACVDAKGDCWLWGVGYDQSGQIGRSLKGKVGNLLQAGTFRAYELRIRELLSWLQHQESSWA